METVYLETTVVGYLTGRIQTDALIASRQIVTRRWWSIAPTRFRLLASQMVLDECGAGDTQAATERLGTLAGIELLDATDDVDQLAEILTTHGAVPASQPRDAG